MKKLILEMELTYEDETMHGDVQDSIDWFMTDVLLEPLEQQGLILFSNCCGDFIGDCKVVKILD